MLDHTQTNALEDACAETREELRRAAAKRDTSKYQELAQAAYQLAKLEHEDALTAYATEERRLSRMHLRTFICTDYDGGRHAEPIIVMARSVADARDLINAELASEGHQSYGEAPYSIYECWERGATRLLCGSVPVDLSAFHEDPVEALDAERSLYGYEEWPDGRGSAVQERKTMADIVAALMTNAPPVEDPLAGLFS